MKTLARILIVAPLVIVVVAGAFVGLMTFTLSGPPGSYTPLMKAAYDGKTKEVLRLIKAGADVNEKTPQGTTALMAAARADELETARVLIEHGADVNAFEPEGDTEVTALMIAARYGRIEMLQLLIASKADVFFQTCNGYTAFQRAERNNQTEALRLLNEAARARPAPAAVAPAAPAAPAARPADTKPGFRDCDVCPEMVAIPAGSFMMGSPDSEPKRSAVESPRHQVTIAYSFAAGKYEVTFDEWQTCMNEGGCSHNPDDMGWGRGRRPVINVSWDDAKQYVAWLSRKTGKNYRLLSEAEWEYAARAGTTTAFTTGATISPLQENYNTKCLYAGGPTSPDRRQTVPVGSFASNAFGLYDVHGNAAEWVEDCWIENYAGAPVDGSAWISGNCKVRNNRGGSFASRPEHTRSAFRGSILSGERFGYGLRVAKTD